MNDLTHPFTPNGCRYNGTSEIIPGRKLHHWTDGYTGGDFCVPDEQATEEGIRRHQRGHRERFTSAGPSFAPVP